jgi:DNA-binding response OmpR family regulator
MTACSTLRNPHDGVGVMAVHVLLLEDDPDCMGFLEAALTAEGHRVSICRSPDDVLGLARRFPDVIALVDFWGNSQVKLSDDDRADLLRLGTAVPTILVTGRTWAARCSPEDIGVMAILFKPFEIGALYEVVDRCARWCRIRASRVESTTTLA